MSETWLNAKDKDVDPANEPLGFWPVAIAVVSAIFDLISKNESDKAAQHFKDEVLGRLAQIQAELDELSRELVELGVRLAEEIERVPVRIAMANILGCLGVVQTAYPTYKDDRARARANFDSLNEASLAGAAYGPAMLPLLGTALGALYSIMVVSKELDHQSGKDTLNNLKEVYLSAFEAMDDANVVGSLAAQEKILNDLVSHVNKNLDAIPLGPIFMGSHNYQATDVWVLAERDVDGVFLFDKWDQPRSNTPQPPARLPNRIEPFPNFSDLIYYIRGAEQPPEPAVIYSGFGGDRHGSIYGEWYSDLISEVRTLESIKNTALQEKDALTQSRNLLQKLVKFCGGPRKVNALKSAEPFSLKAKFDAIPGMARGRVGFIRLPERPKMSLTIGQGGKILVRRSPLLASPAGLLPGLPTPKFVQDNYEHSWHCVFACDSHLHWQAHCVDERDGSVIVWDNIEVGARNDTNRVTPDDVGQQPYTQHFSKASCGSVDWDKDGHDPDFNSGIKFWLNSIWWHWELWSHA